MKNSTRKKKAQREAEEWNALYKVGQKVMVKKDFQKKGTLTTTYSEASVMCGSAVIWLEGISGCYALSVVTPI